VQSFPHAPQLLTSVVVSEHVDEQQVWDPHEFPQLPQFFASEEVSSHMPPQHAGTTRLSMAVQSLPLADAHPPQFVSSVVVSVHTPSHCVGVGAMQPDPHLPAAHT